MGWEPEGADEVVAGIWSMGTAKGAKFVANIGAGKTATEDDVDSITEEETYKGSTVESSAQKWQGVVETCVVVGDDVLESGSREQGS